MAFMALASGQDIEEDQLLQSQFLDIHDAIAIYNQEKTANILQVLESYLVNFDFFFSFKLYKIQNFFHNSLSKKSGTRVKSSQTKMMP